MAHSPHRRWRGCRLCKPHKIHGAGRAHKEPIPVLRKIGKSRRLTRHEIPEYREDDERIASPALDDAAVAP